MSNINIDFEERFVKDMELQDTINSVVDPEWKSARYDYYLAAHVETIEFIDHIGWKWWKHQEPDYDQAFMELVDIYHFLLAKAIEENFRPSNDKIINAIKYNNRLWDSDIEVAKFLAATLVDRTLDIAFNTLFTLVSRFEFDGQDPFVVFFETFVQKGTLNVFRQNNGYKDGTYMKVWDDKEDNQHLMDLVKFRPEIAANHDKLYEAFSNIYHSAIDRRQQGV